MRALLACGRRLATVVLVLSISACGGGGGGGGGGTVSGSFDPSTATSVPVYSHSISAGVPYSATMIAKSGDPYVAVTDADPNQTLSYSTYAAAYDTFFYGSTNINNASFIAPADGTAYVWVLSSTASTFDIYWTENLLTVDGPAASGQTNGDSVYYAFDAQAGTSYDVKLQPTSGNVDIGVVSPNANLSSSYGSSTNSGTQTDSVYFTATATQRHYIKLYSTGVDSAYQVSVATVPSATDLTVDINSAQSDGSNVILNYTISNVGATGYTGDVQLDGWAAAASAPSVGDTGDLATTLTGVTIPGLGGTVTGTMTIPNSSDSGTAYLIVDTTNVITEGNENNNVSAGVDWTKPIIAPVTYDFESGVIPAKTVMSGSADWLIDNTTGGSGSTTSIGSGAITDGASSCFALTVYDSQSVSINFDYRVSSEQYYDYLRFYIDGVEQDLWSGEIAWANTSFAAAPGQHEYKWCYTKDSTPGSYSGSDRAWVDNIAFTTAPTDLSVSITGVSYDGSNATVNYTVYNNSSIPAGAFNVDFWPNLSSAPAVGDTGDATTTVSGVAAYSYVTGSITIPTSATYGTAYAIVDTANVVQETDETNNVSTGYAWAPDLKVNITSAVSDGSNVTINYKVVNKQPVAVGAFTLDLWANSASAPTIGSTGDTTVNISGLGASANTTGSVTIPDTAASGTAYGVVDTANTIVETNENNNVSAGYLWMVPVAAPVTYDFETGTVPTSLMMSGDAAWVIDSSTAAGGSTYSLKAGTITNSQTSCTAVAATGATSVAFDYSVSSESGYDFLEFYIDGSVMDQWSGTVAWANTSYTVTTGTHTFMWCYTKDVSVSVGSDTAWVDNITIN